MTHLPKYPSWAIYYSRFWPSLVSQWPCCHGKGMGMGNVSRLVSNLSSLGFVNNWKKINPHHLQRKEFSGILLDSHVLRPVLSEPRWRDPLQMLGRLCARDASYIFIYVNKYLVIAISNIALSYIMKNIIFPFCLFLNIPAPGAFTLLTHCCSIKVLLSV